MLNTEIAATVKHALAEDIGAGDISAALIPADTTSSAQVICREEAIICGRAWFNDVFHQLDPGVTITWQLGDGDAAKPEQQLCSLHGNARALLSGERTALNFLQTLSGTATLAHHYQQQVEDLAVTLLDTRKTLPGLRTAQKYAVRCGGCSNHRIGLYDGILIKENHIAACGSISQAIAMARAQTHHVPIEVEVENLAEMTEALAQRADRLLLDNFTVAQLHQAVELNRGQAQLEASGGITLKNVRQIAASGVDYISIGALTKDVQATDLSMRITFDR